MVRKGDCRCYSVPGRRLSRIAGKKASSFALTEPTFDRYVRNRVRLDLIPRLLEHNPNLSETVTNMSAFMADENDFIDGLAGQLLDSHSRFADESSRLNWTLAQAHPSLARRAIPFAIEKIRGERTDIYSTHVEDVLDLIHADNRSGSLSLPGGAIVRKRYGW